MTAATDTRPARLLLLTEAAALFVLGTALMTFVYRASTPGPTDEIGAPGHDSFYHTKMAAMLPEHGLVATFPWLQYAWFTQDTDDFVSHHTGFHILLLPFVEAAQWVGGDPLMGGRWAVAAFFGLNVVLFNLLLRQGNVPLRWVWIVLFLLMPDQFFTRHAFIRAIGASLMFMQLLFLFLLRGRHMLAGLTIAAYIHLYLGAVLYTPVIVALFALANVLGPTPDRRWPWRMVGITAAGWTLGVLTYPYFDGMMEFLKLQVTGTGLSPDISVGREWKPYSDPWWFVNMAGVVLAVWTAALCLRLRSGPRLSASELALLLAQFAFLALTLKARRFIEYWPVLALLSAAWMSAPVVNNTIAAASGWYARRSNGLRAVLQTLALGGGAVSVVALLVTCVTTEGAGPVLAEWRVWAGVLALLLLAPLSAIWAGRTEDEQRILPIRLLVVSGVGAALVAVVAMAVQLGGEALPQARLHVTSIAWMALAAAYVVVPATVYSLSRTGGPLRAIPATTRTASVVLAGLGLFGGTIAVGSEPLAKIARQSRCRYDLSATRDLMNYLQTHSQPGDVVFTDDWDIFPLFFYHNSHNRYIVGLDPKFTHERRPDLWERYVKVTRGEVPARTSIELASLSGAPTKQVIDVRLEDIRDEFHAQYVITDQHHKALARLLARTPRLAALVYPETDYRACRNAPYLLFRIRKPGESVPVAGPPQPNAEGQLYLSQLIPAAAEQGWGDLQTNSTVEQRRIQMLGRRYRYGLGTHAPSRLLFDIPAGYAFFEATVGVDDETGGDGSIVARIALDGQRVFTSPILTGTSEPAVVRMPLSGARQILLEADPTDDGNRFDHVNWAGARFVRTDKALAGEIRSRAGAGLTSAEVK